MSQLRIILVGRADCPCLISARQVLRDSRKRYVFEWKETILDPNDDDGVSVEDSPLLLVNGRTRFRREVNSVLLERLLIGEGAPRVVD